jgi:AcrR family transcriptional regulator
MGSEPVGLREQKKRQTRQDISNVAIRMFISRGFDKVTIAEVAAAAGVAKMTVTNHFPRKEDLVLDLHEELVTGLAQAIAERRTGESALAALRRDYFAALDRRDAAIGFSGQIFVQMITESPALLARLREIHEDREAAVAAVLASETGVGPDAIAPRAAAAYLAATHRVLFAAVFRRTLAGEENDRIAASMADVARQAFDLLTPSLGDYAVR